MNAFEDETEIRIKELESENILLKKTIKIQNKTINRLVNKFILDKNIEHKLEIVSADTDGEAI